MVSAWKGGERGVEGRENIQIYCAIVSLLVNTQTREFWSVCQCDSRFRNLSVVREQFRLTVQL